MNLGVAILASASLASASSSRGKSAESSSDCVCAALIICPDSMILRTYSIRYVMLGHRVATRSGAFEVSLARRIAAGFCAQTLSTYLNNPSASFSFSCSSAYTGSAAVHLYLKPRVPVSWGASRSQACVASRSSASPASRLPSFRILFKAKSHLPFLAPARIRILLGLSVFGGENPGLSSLSTTRLRALSTTWRILPYY